MRGIFQWPAYPPAGHLFNPRGGLAFVRHNTQQPLLISSDTVFLYAPQPKTFTARQFIYRHDKEAVIFVVDFAWRSDRDSNPD